MDRRDILLCLIKLGNIYKVRMSNSKMIKILSESNYQDYFNWRESKYGLYSRDVLELLDKLSHENVISPIVEEINNQFRIVDYELNTDYECSEALKEEFEPVIKNMLKDRVDIENIVLYTFYKGNEKGHNISRKRLMQILYMADLIYQEKYHTKPFQVQWFRGAYRVWSPLIYKIVAQLRQQKKCIPETVQGKERKLIINHKVLKEPELPDPRMQAVISEAIDVFFNDEAKRDEYLKTVYDLPYYNKPHTKRRKKS